MPGLAGVLKRAPGAFVLAWGAAAQDLDSAYSIRLYQWAKSRQFLRRPQQVSVDDLRHFLGTIEIDADGAITKESLKRYNDFKKVALQPAVRELTKRPTSSSLFMSFESQEQKSFAQLFLVLA